MVTITDPTASHIAIEMPSTGDVARTNRAEQYEDLAGPYTLHPSQCIRVESTSPYDAIQPLSTESHITPDDNERNTLRYSTVLPVPYLAALVPDEPADTNHDTNTQRTYVGAIRIGKKKRPMRADNRLADMIVEDVISINRSIQRLVPAFGEMPENIISFAVRDLLLVGKLGALRFPLDLHEALTFARVSSENAAAISLTAKYLRVAESASTLIQPV